MGVTKKLISDEVLYKLAGGIPSPSFLVHEQDVWSSLEDKINSHFKLKHFDTTLPSGETLPENTMIATYQNITVTATSNERSYALLPITPISLPLNMGIFMVYDERYPDNFFIPLQRSQLALLKADSLLNDLMGQFGYEPKSDRVVFTKDITLLGVTEVTMELCVFDMSQYSVTANLPIPSDYVDTIVQQLTEEFAPIVAKTGIENRFVNPTQHPVK